MPSDSPSHGRRHFHRSRRGHDRRGGDRRSTPPPNQPADQTQRGAGEVDVEQIMREIRSKIAQRHGVELTDQQVQDLAARRLEAILDPRTIKPSLLEQLRRSAGARPDSVAAADRAAAPYEFEDTTLYDSPSGFTRFLRRLLNPILKLFFNPNPLIRALHIQSQLNTENVRREAERDQRQAEWNALHYEILQRVVTETARVSLELQDLALKIESLSAKVDFNERRVRGIEGVVHQPRAGGGRERDREIATPMIPSAVPPATETATTPAMIGSPESPAAEAPRRRRRRRRGRRGGAPGEMMASMPAGSPVSPDAMEADEVDEGDADVDIGSDIVTTGTEAIEQTEGGPDVVRAPVSDAAPEHVTPQLTQSEPAAREEAVPELPATTEPPDKM